MTHYLRQQIARSVNRARLTSALRAAVAAFSLWALVTFLRAASTADRIVALWREATTQLPPVVLAGLLGAAFLVFLIILWRISDAVTGWVTWRRVVWPDVLVLTLAEILWISWYMRLDPGLATATLSFALLFTLTLLLRTGVVVRWNLRSEVQEPATSLLDSVLGEFGTAPLPNLGADDLQRSELVRSIVELVRVKRASSVNVGVEGAWGSGKTTLLNALQVDLEAYGLSVLRFDAWSYREPTRLVQGFFGAIERALGRIAASPGLRRRVRKLTIGLAEVGGARAASAARILFGDLADEGLEEQRSELATILQTLRTPLVVFLDDLDRLDPEELQAVLRSVRLVSKLPNLTHVLAYDREQLARTLFPADPSGARSRDYLAQVIDLEFSVGILVREGAYSLLNTALEPLLASTSEEERLAFQERFRQFDPRTFISSMATPREIRRVATATAGVWERMRRHVNLFDLFVVTIIQYRYPKVYSMLRARPEWFFAMNWYFDSWRVSNEKQWIAAGKEYRESLVGEPELMGALPLLEMLFPNLVQHESEPAQEVARKERRILHPEIFDRYFFLYMPKRVVTEADIEDFASRLEATPAGESRQALVHERLESEVAAGRIDSFLEQWLLVFGDQNAARLGQELIRDLVVGLARAAAAFSTRERFLFGWVRRVAAYRAMTLVGALAQRRSCDGGVGKCNRDGDRSRVCRRSYVLCRPSGEARGYIWKAAS